MWARFYSPTRQLDLYSLSVPSIPEQIVVMSISTFLASFLDLLCVYSACAQQNL